MNCSRQANQQAIVVVSVGYVIAQEGVKLGQISRLNRAIKINTIASLRRFLKPLRYGW